MLFKELIITVYSEKNTKIKYILYAKCRITEC